MDRICWDDYFSIMALLISCRSSDHSTRHGAVAIDQKNRLLGIGFNGTPRGCQENLIPQTRPEKYNFYIHAESNLIMNCNSNLQDAKVYVTGHPCLNCLGLLIQKGIKEVVYGPVKSTNKESPNTIEHINNLKEILLTNQNIILREWQPNNLNLILSELSNLTNLIKENYQGG